MKYVTKRFTTSKTQHLSERKNSHLYTTGRSLPRARTGKSFLHPTASISGNKSSFRWKTFGALHFYSQIQQFKLLHDVGFLLSTVTYANKKLVSVHNSYIFKYELSISYFIMHHTPIDHMSKLSLFLHTKPIVCE